MTSERQDVAGRYGAESDGPTYWLSRYKTTQRPRKCTRCTQNAYHHHTSYGYLCAPHLLDLININEELWKWSEYPEIWARTERLLQREPLSSTSVPAMESTQNVNTSQQSDGS